MNYRLSQKVLLVFCVLSLASIIGFLATQLQIFFYLCVACFLAGFVQAYIFYRCPSCKKVLMRHGRAVPEKCPHCGNKIP